MWGGSRWLGKGKMGCKYSTELFWEAGYFGLTTKVQYMFFLPSFSYPTIYASQFACIQIINQ